MKTALKKHILTQHEGVRVKLEKKFPCEVCNKLFIEIRLVKRHMTEVHEGVRSHKCESCGKMFARKSNLKIHVDKVHKGIENNYNIVTQIL